MCRGKYVEEYLTVGCTQANKFLCLFVENCFFFLVFVFHVFVWLLFVDLIFDTKTHLFVTYAEHPIPFRHILFDLFDNLDDFCFFFLAKFICFCMCERLLFVGSVWNYGDTQTEDRIQRFFIFKKKMERKEREKKNREFNFSLVKAMKIEYLYKCV